MSSLVLSGDTSGSVTVNVPAVAGTNTVTIPATTGTVMVSSNMPAFSAYLSSNQSITSSTRTKIAFNVKTFDTASAYDNITNYRFTPQVAGYYQISAAMDSSLTTAQTRAFCMIYKNGSEYARLQDSSGTTIYAQSGSVLIYCNGTTDYLEVYGQINGTSPAFGSGSISTWFTGVLVRAA